MSNTIIQYPLNRKSIIFMLLLIIAQLFCAKGAEPDSTARVAINTNALHWLTATPNLGAEWKISERYSGALSFGYNAINFPNHNNSLGNPANPKMHHWLLTGEGRRWFGRVFSGPYLGVHLLGGQFNAGGLRFPRFLADHRYEGFALGAGVSFGHQWCVAPDWTVGASLGAGWLYLNYDKYNCGSCGTRMSHRARNLGFLTKASISVSYLIPSARRKAIHVKGQGAVDSNDAKATYYSNDSRPAEDPVVLNDPEGLNDIKAPAAPDTLRFTIYYDVDRHEPMVREVREYLELLREHEILSVAIDGYASPEYTADHNLHLSGRRARGVAEVVATDLALPASVITVTAHGDDWEGLATKSVAGGQSDDVRRILSLRQDPDSRKHAIQRIPGYRTLLRTVYPLLRRTEVRIIHRPKVGF